MYSRNRGNGLYSASSPVNCKCHWTGAPCEVQQQKQNGLAAVFCSAVLEAVVSCVIRELANFFFETHRYKFDLSVDFISP